MISAVCESVCSIVNEDNNSPDVRGLVGGFDEEIQTRSQPTKCALHTRGLTKSRFFYFSLPTLGA